MSEFKNILVWVLANYDYEVNKNLKKFMIYLNFHFKEYPWFGKR